MSRFDSWCVYHKLRFGPAEKETPHHPWSLHLVSALRLGYRTQDKPCKKAFLLFSLQCSQVSKAMNAGRMLYNQWYFLCIGVSCLIHCMEFLIQILQVVYDWFLPVLFGWPWMTMFVGELIGLRSANHLTSIHRYIRWLVDIPISTVTTESVTQHFDGSPFPITTVRGQQFESDPLSSIVTMLDAGLRDGLSASNWIASSKCLSDPTKTPVGATFCRYLVLGISQRQISNVL